MKSYFDRLVECSPEELAKKIVKQQSEIALAMSDLELMQRAFIKSTEKRANRNSKESKYES